MVWVRVMWVQERCSHFPAQKIAAVTLLVPKQMVHNACIHSLHHLILVNSVYPELIGAKP